MGEGGVSTFAGLFAGIGGILVEPLLSKVKRQANLCFEIPLLSNEVLIQPDLLNSI